MTTWYRDQDVLKAEIGTAFDDLDLQTPYLAELPSNGITAEGHVEINDWVRRALRRHGGRYRRSFALPPSWVWEWMITANPADRGLVGTMPKRIAKWLYKTHDMKLSPEEMAEIGTISKTHTIEDDTYIFDITDDLDWRDGDFGDADSCYWSTNKIAKEYLFDAGGLGFRVFRNEPEKVIDSIVNLHGEWYCRKYDRKVTILSKTFACTCDNCMFVIEDDARKIEKYGDGLYFYPHKIYKTLETYGGVGRCWVIPRPEGLVLFNSYGKYQLFAMARLLATIIGQSYRKVTAIGNEEGMWINVRQGNNEAGTGGGGGSMGKGYLIGPTEEIGSVEEVNLDSGEYTRYDSDED